MKVFSFNLIACLRKDLGENFEKMTVESIFEQIIEFPALVQAKGDKIIITFYGNYKNNHKAAVQKLMKKFDETGMNAPISWLGNRRIEIRFK